MTAFNQAKASAFSPKIQINAKQVCNSKLAKLLNDKSVVKEFTVTLYPEDFTNDVNNTSVLKTFLVSNGFSKFAETDCALVAPLINLPNANLSTATDVVTFEFNPNITLNVSQTTLTESLFVLKAVVNGYGPTTVQVELRDTLANSLKLSFTFSICGDVYYDPIVCTRPRSSLEV